MRLRLAKVTDAKHLASLHAVCTAGQPYTFMDRLGKPFLTQYYRVMLEEKNSVVICAEDSEGQIIGFASGSLDAGEHTTMLRRNRIRLLLAALPALIRHPRLIKGVYSRQKLASADGADAGYIVLSGARGEFWVWLPTVRSAGGAVALFQKWLSLMRLLGAREVRFEVDGENRRVEEMHLLLGARVSKEFVTPEGRRRLLMAYPAQD